MERNPVKRLEEGWILLSDQPGREPYGYGYYRDEADKPFRRNHLHPGLAGSSSPRVRLPVRLLRPWEHRRRSPAARRPKWAGPVPRLRLRPARIGQARKDGVLAGPTLRAMEKGVALGDDSAFELPEPHGLYFELLRTAGAIRTEENTAVADPSRLARMLAPSDARQACSWARGWLQTEALVRRSWYARGGQARVRKTRGNRPTGCGLGAGGLAHRGDQWYELNSFLSALDTLQGDVSLGLPYDTLAWKPKLTLAKNRDEPGLAAQQRIRERRRELAWYANVLMVTLVALGLVERGRLGRAVDGPHVFRLTALGRAVFGAPEIAPPRGLGEGRFLVVQPNFDLLAYVDQADAASAGLLGRMAESDSAQTGPVQTFRLTQTSVYQAQESGLSHDRIVAYLEQHTRGRSPPMCCGHLPIGAGSARAWRSARAPRSWAFPPRSTATLI